MNIIQPIKNHKIIVKNTGYLTAVEVMRMLLPFVALPYVNVQSVENAMGQSFLLKLSYPILLFLLTLEWTYRQ